MTSILCPHCQGDGFTDNEDVCPVCDDDLSSGTLDLPLAPWNADAIYDIACRCCSGLVAQEWRSEGIPCCDDGTEMENCRAHAA